MAIVGTDEDENNPNGLPTSSSSPNARAATAAAQGVPYNSEGGGGFVGGAGTGSGQGATTGAPGEATPTKGGGGYTNLSQYLQANQDTGAATGRAAENVVQQSADQATQAQGTFGVGAGSDITDATKAVTADKGVISGINAGAPQVSKDVLGSIKSGGYQYAPKHEWTTALNDPRKASEDVLGQIVKEGAKATPDYAGPSDFSGYTYGGPQSVGQVSYQGPLNTGAFTGNTAAAQQDFVGKQGLLQGNVNNAQGGQAGVSALLRGAYQQPSYTKGENNLDGFLAGGTPGGREALGQAAGVGKGVDDSYKTLLGQLQGRIDTGVKTADETNATYADTIDKAGKTAAATQGSYGTAMKAAQTRGVSDSASAKEAAKKAQDELDRRTAATKAAIPAAKAPANVTGKTSGAVKKAAGDTSAALKTARDQVMNPTNTGAPIDTLAVKGAKAATKDLQNPINTGTPANLNFADKASEALGNIGKDISSPIKTGPPISLPKVKLKFAQGGEVPSYAQLCKMLRRK